jgi:hypothetical protein
MFGGRTPLFRVKSGCRPYLSADFGELLTISGLLISFTTKLPPTPGEYHGRLRSPQNARSAWARVRHRTPTGGRSRHRSSMGKSRFLTAPARCGHAHRGLLMEINHEPGARQDKTRESGEACRSQPRAALRQPIRPMTDERAPRSSRGEPRPA